MLKWASKVVILSILVMVGFAHAGSKTWHSDNGNGTFSNPLFWDEFSDPDLIRVGKDFYLTGTTMHSMPGLPILHSVDLVNWDFVTYALDKLDLGPEFRLEDGKNVYGQGIWAPCFRYHDGTFYIFSNVNHKTTQLFRASSPRGPWTRTPMKRSFHDLSVLFDDDGKTYVIWGYRSIHLAQLTKDFTDVVPGSEREIIAPSQGMGEGLHLYKVNSKYFITSAWYLDVMRMPTARADSLTGPWEVNQKISVGEDFGFAQGNRLKTPYGSHAPFTELIPDLGAVGRNAIHQGGIVETPTGEWWGFSMMDANSIGRLVTLSPVTWTDGWPYFGLTGNLGRSPRIWVKPNTGVSGHLSAPYKRSDDFSATTLQSIWQWNHVPVDGKWSLSERPGFLRLHALPAQNLWTARNTLTQRAIGPHSIPTTVLETDGMQPGDVAGLALFNRPYAWIGVSREERGFALQQFDEESGNTVELPVAASTIWLRADCDFLKEIATFSYSVDGKDFHAFGKPFTMVMQGMTFQGVRYSLFDYNIKENTRTGFADFDSFEVEEPDPRALTRAIPFRKHIILNTVGSGPRRIIGSSGSSLGVNPKSPLRFKVEDRGLGRVALCGMPGCVSVSQDGVVSIRRGKPGTPETFQWIETFTHELTLMSLSTNRYLRVDEQSGILRADSPGPLPSEDDGVRFDWRVDSGRMQSSSQ